MIKNTGKKYEEFVSIVYKLAYSKEFKSQNIILHSDVKINKDGNIDKKGRQFDIYWQLIQFGTITRYAIECKDYKNKVSQEKIEAFVTKTKDCNINKALFVSRNGFQEGCYNVASKHGIDLLVIKSIDEYIAKQNIIKTIICKITMCLRAYIETPSVSFDVPETYRAQFKKLLSNYSNFYLSASIIFKSGLIYKKLHCLNYIQNIINQNKNNELINVHNRIEKKFTNKEAYLCFSDTNIPLNALLIRYIFDVSYRTNEIKIDNPNFYNTIAIIEKKLNDDNINETTFVKNK